MQDLTDVKNFLASLFQPIIYEAIRDHLAATNYQPPAPATSTAEPYGDFTWLTATCSGIPASTLRGKSAAGKIPGLKKIGKRVLYHKATVLKWLDEQTRPDKPTAEKLEQAAHEQFTAQTAKRNAA